MNYGFFGRNRDSTKNFKAKKWWENFGLKLETFLLPKTTLFNANRLQIFIWNFSQSNIKMELRSAQWIFNLKGMWVKFYVRELSERLDGWKNWMIDCLCWEVQGFVYNISPTNILQCWLPHIPDELPSSIYFPRVFMVKKCMCEDLP